MEGFIARVPDSIYGDRLVLKGGMLMSAYSERRPTRDVDLHATGIPSNMESLSEVAINIASINHHDGIEFKTETTTARVIREHDDYSGIRIGMDASIHTANLRLKIDFSVGDPISPEPDSVRIHSVIPGGRPIVITSFPITMVLAEKIVTTVSRGVANTRWRDFADIVSIVLSRSIDGTAMYKSLHVVAEHRNIELRPLADVLAGFAQQAQGQWIRWLVRQRLEDQFPDDFGIVLHHVATFADPAMSNHVIGRTWSPTDHWKVQNLD